LGTNPHMSKPEWSDEEIDFLKKNREHGARWIADRLDGRTVKAVQRKAERMRISLSAPGEIDAMCPICNAARIVKRSHAARFGICPTCYFKEERRRFDAMSDEIEARAEKEAARQRYYDRKMKHDAG